MAEINTFYMVPKRLFEAKYSELSPISKLSYALLLERYNLSLKNGWRDTDGHPYIYYPIINLAKILNISKPTSLKCLKELEAFDLIKRVRQGTGKPDKIKLYISAEPVSAPTVKEPKGNYDSIVTYDISDLEKLINR